MLPAGSNLFYKESKKVMLKELNRNYTIKTAELLPNLATFKNIYLWNREFQYKLELTIAEVIEMLTPHENAICKEMHGGDLIIMGRGLLRKNPLSLKDRILHAIDKAHPAPLPHSSLLKITWRYGNASDVLTCLQELAQENKIIQSVVKNGYKEAMLYNIFPQQVVQSEAS